MKKRDPKRLALHVETIRLLSNGELGRAQAGFAGPSHDQYQQFKSCMGCTTTVSLG